MEILIICLLAGLLLSASAGLRGWLMYYEARRLAEIDHNQLEATISFLQRTLDRRA